jgi:SagB-type dehydrogenase family enzyme
MLMYIFYNMMFRVLLLAVLIVVVCLSGCTGPGGGEATGAGADVIKLPAPSLHGNTSVEEALLNRRSVREFKDEPLTLQEVSQLLWAAQGITGMGRTAPSAGALYPLEVYVAIGNVEGVAPGVYRYSPGENELKKTAGGDKRQELCDAALGQASVKNGAADIVIAGVYGRTTEKYGERGVRYVHMEAGHAAQNVCLQAVSLHLGTVTIGAFYDDRVKNATGMRGDEQPLYVMPVGRI